MACLNNFIKQFYPNVALQLPSDALILITDVDAYPCITIKHQDKGYIATESPLEVKGYVEPKNHPSLVKSMQGKIYPLYLGSDKPNAVLGIYMPQNQLLNLDINKALQLPAAELRQVLNRKSYTVKIKNIELKISKVELLCFIQLLKGKHAGEIAAIFNLKQVTVESYIKNLKNKCGVSLKSDLFAFFIENKILQQIVV